MRRPLAQVTKTDPERRSSGGRSKARDWEQLELFVEKVEELTCEEEQWLQELLFTWDEKDHGKTDMVYHHIPMGTAVPNRERYQPVPPKPVHF